LGGLGWIKTKISAQNLLSTILKIGNFEICTQKFRNLLKKCQKKPWNLLKIVEKQTISSKTDIFTTRDRFIWIFIKKFDKKKCMN
jgi:nucleoside-triphosphatase THEP1